MFEVRYFLATELMLKPRRRKPNHSFAAFPTAIIESAFWHEIKDIA